MPDNSIEHIPKPFIAFTSSVGGGKWPDKYYQDFMDDTHSEFRMNLVRIFTRRFSIKGTTTFNLNTMA